MGAAFAYDTYTNPPKNNGVLGATLTDNGLLDRMNKINKIELSHWCQER